MYVSHIPGIEISVLPTSTVRKLFDFQDSRIGTLRSQMFFEIGTCLVPNQPLTVQIFLF